MCYKYLIVLISDNVDNLFPFFNICTHIRFDKYFKMSSYLLFEKKERKKNDEMMK